MLHLYDIDVHWMICMQRYVEIPTKRCVELGQVQHFCPGIASRSWIHSKHSWGDRWGHRCDWVNKRGNKDQQSRKSLHMMAYININHQRKFRNLTSDYTESCCWRSDNQQMWSRRCDIAEMWDMRIWRVGSARNAVFYHTFVASPARKVRS